MLCSLCVCHGVAVRSNQHLICDNLLPGRDLLLQTRLINHISRYRLTETATSTPPLSHTTVPSVAVTAAVTCFCFQQHASKHLPGCQRWLSSVQEVVLRASRGSRPAFCHIGRHSPPGGLGQHRLLRPLHDWRRGVGRQWSGG